MKVIKLQDTMMNKKLHDATVSDPPACVYYKVLYNVDRPVDRQISLVLFRLKTADELFA